MAAAKEKNLYEVARRWFRDVYETKPSVLPKHLYHYTDAAGLIGTLRSGRIWATDYRFLNDKSEVEHTRSLVRTIVAERLARSTDHLVSALCAKLIAMRETEPRDSIFVFSLSEEEDDLSQWRGYARDGEGFTIGFCGRSLYELSEPDDADYGFCKVEYRLAEQISAINNALDDIDQEMRRQIAADGARKDAIVEKAAETFDALIKDVAAAKKHKSFMGEREWRAVSVIDEDGLDAVKVRARGTRLVRYTELNLGGSAGKLPIKRIGIGPGFSGNEEVHAVKALCHETGYDPEIYFADTPYRRV